MNATFLKRWTAWLLPLLVLRAFIPMGFMLSAGSHGLQLTFCPGIAMPASGHAAAAEPGDEHAGHSGHHGNSQQHDQAPCPFGLVSAAASAEPILGVPSGITADGAISLPAIPLLDRSPARAEPIRGPPLVSLEALI